MKILSIRSHHRAFSFFLTVLAFLCVLCGKSSAQEFKTVHDGVEYAEVTREISGLKVNMNLLRLDLTKVRLDVHHAMDAAIGTEKTSSIATRHGAVAAINAGFFRLDKSKFAGDAAGVLMIDGQFLSESVNDRAAMISGNSKRSTAVFFSHVATYHSIELGSLGGVRLSGVDRERKTGEAVLYNAYFGESTRTKENGIEIILDKCKRVRWRIFEKTVCLDVTVLDDAKDSKIPVNGHVVSFEGEFLQQRSDFVGAIKNFAKLHGRRRAVGVINEVEVSQGHFFRTDKSDDVTNGVPQLIKDGKIDITWEQEKVSKSFVETRHPRTAVAKLKDGKFLMITVDGRSESSGGIGLQDLAEYLLSLGATDAMNLDGGGSTTMFLDGKVVNHPSDKEGERKVSDAILVTLRKKK